jgi:alanine racemase
MAFCKISKNKLFHNLAQFEKLIPLEKIGVVLKRNAYGHGIIEIANLIKEYGVQNVIVKDISEANLIQDLFNSVLVLYDIPEGNLPNNVSIAINSIENIEKIPQNTSVELKIDTGMHRNGIRPDQIEKALKLINKNRLILKGVFTHFACSNENNNSIFNQKEIFDKIKTDILSCKMEENPRFHCSATAGTLRFDNKEYDLVRIGLGVFGYVDIDEAFNHLNLKPVLSLWANKVSTRSIQKDETIGYGGAFKAEKQMIVSTYDIGYGDGFFRLNEDSIFLIENGNPILGRTSMDSFSTIGDQEEVCIFNDVSKLSELNNTIVYESLVRIDQKMKRIITK